MDRINGADTVDIGSGRRGFRDENLVAGVAGTEVTADFLNATQEEIIKVVTAAGLEPSASDWTQLWQALQILGLSADTRSRQWLAVTSMTVTSPPASPASGDTYLIPSGASGVWSANVGNIAQWTGSAWSYLTPPNGHGISLPDGRVFERVNGAYVEKIAADAQTGKWNFATVGGTASAFTLTLVPAPAALVDGMSVMFRATLNNTGNATINLNGLGAVAVTAQGGIGLNGGEFVAGQIYEITYSASASQWMIMSQSGGQTRVVDATIDGAAVNLLTAKRLIQSGVTNYAVASGTANALTATLSPVPLSLPAGMTVAIRTTITNTGPATFNLNGFGAASILTKSGQALKGGEITPGITLLRVAAANAGWELIAITDAEIAYTINNIMPPRPNLCPNGGFEDGIANIVVTKSGSGTWPSAISTNGWGRSLYLTGTKTDGTYLITWPSFPVDAGSTYTISGDAVLLATSGTVRYQIVWLDSTGATISTSTAPTRGPGDFDDSNARRQSMAAALVAPTGTVKAQLQCVFDTVLGAAAIFARLAKVEKGALPATAYTPPPPKTSAYFRMNMGGNSVTVPGSTVTTMSNFANASSSLHSDSTLNASAGTVTIGASDAGIWALSAGGSIPNSAATEEDIFLFQNGNYIAWDKKNYPSGGADMLDQSITTIVQLAAGDVIKAAYLQVSASGSYALTSTMTYFAGVKIGE